MSSVPRRVWRGTTLLVLGRIFGSLCTVLILWTTAQKLPDEAFGRFTFYLAVFALLDSLADFGTGQIAVQRTAGDESAIPPVLAATRRIRLATGSLGVLLVGGGALMWREPGAGWILLASLYPVTHVFELSSTIFRNRIAWGVPVAMRVIANALSLGFVLALAAAGDKESSHYLCGVALGSAISNGLLHLVARRHLPRAEVPKPPIRDLLLAALPLGLASLFQQAYFWADNVFVRAICGEIPLGHYNVGVRVMAMTIMVALFASQAALPWLAREHAAGRLSEAVAKLSQPLFALACVGAGSLWPWTERILAIFGEEFASAGGSLRWLLGATAIIYAGSGLMTALVAAGKMRSILAIAAVGLAVNLVANTLLVPTMGIDGAGAATLATEAVVTMGANIALARIGVRPFAGARGLLWVAGPVLFAGTAWGSSHLPLPWILGDV
ncbi:MAG: lipopolysaccharide biosynthesis protein [Planctomycetota bacterium]